MTERIDWIGMPFFSASTNTSQACARSTAAFSTSGWLYFAGSVCVVFWSFASVAAFLLLQPVRTSVDTTRIASSVRMVFFIFMSFQKNNPTFRNGFSAPRGDSR